MHLWHLYGRDLGTALATWCWDLAGLVRRPVTEVNVEVLQGLSGDGLRFRFVVVQDTVCTVYVLNAGSERRLQLAVEGDGVSDVWTDVLVAQEEVLCSETRLFYGSVRASSLADQVVKCSLEVASLLSSSLYL